MVLVLDNNFILNSKISSGFISRLDDLCQRDYKKSFFHRDIICFDIDKYESSQPGNNQPTIDATIGIADNNATRFVKSRHLLVELRFDYKSTKGFSPSNMVQKDNHSRDILLGENVDNKTIFVYTDNVAPQATYYFRNYSRTYPSMKNWIALSVTGFNNYILDPSLFVYQPINDVGTMQKELKEKYAESGTKGILDPVVYWLDRCDYYKSRYNKNECLSIAQTLIDAITSLPFEASDEYDYLQLLKKDFEQFVN